MMTDRMRYRMRGMHVWSDMISAVIDLNDQQMRSALKGLFNLTTLYGQRNSATVTYGHQSKHH